MTLFKNPFFESESDDVEADYIKGVQSLASDRFDDASTFFQRAALRGHVSALYNLFVIHASGFISPWNFELAADCWYKAANSGHPSAKGNIWMLEAADRGGFGYDNLADMAADPSNNGRINGVLMTCAARFTDVLCKKYGATSDLIAYEIDAARQSDETDVQKFISRTGISRNFTDGGLSRLVEGTAADQITNGLNQFSVAQKRSGLKDAHIRMARCTIIGYVIQKSIYGNNSQPLLGVDKFFL